MTSRGPHIIQRRIIDVKTGDQAAADAFLNQTGEAWNQTLCDVEDMLFDRWAPGTGIRLLDRLEVDLGTVPPETPQEELADHYEACLAAALDEAEDALAPQEWAVAPHSGIGPAGTVTGPVSQVTGATHFLETGQLPWWMEVQNIPATQEDQRRVLNAMTAALRTEVAQNPKAVQAWLHGQSVPERAIFRCRLQLDETLAHQLTQLITAPAAGPVRENPSSSAVQQNFGKSSQPGLADDGPFVSHKTSDATRDLVAANAPSHHETDGLLGPQPDQPLGGRATNEHSAKQEAAGTPGMRDAPENTEAAPKQVQPPVRQPAEPQQGMIGHPAAPGHTSQQKPGTGDATWASPRADGSSDPGSQQDKPTPANLSLRTSEPPESTDHGSGTATEASTKPPGKTKPTATSLPASAASMLRPDQTVTGGTSPQQEPPQHSDPGLASGTGAFTGTSARDHTVVSQDEGEGTPAFRQPVPPGDPTPLLSPQTDQALLVSVAAAGCVLLAPFLPTLFPRVGLRTDDDWKTEQSPLRAAQLVYHLATGATETPQFALQLPMLLCGVPLVTPMPLQLEPTEQEAEACDGLLTAVRNHWAPLSGTSNEGLRTTFLARHGLLKEEDDHWRLHVERGPYDMLLDQLPWSYGTVGFSWMDKILKVEW